MPCIESMALADITHTGFEVLAALPSRGIRMALAASTTTPTVIVDQLVHDHDPGIRRFALARTSDRPALHAATLPGREGLIAVAAHANPLSPIDHLVAGLDSKDRGVRLAAWCNPSTPLEQRTTLSSQTATMITRVGGSLADQVVRAHALVLANPWMLEDPARWDGNIRRALAALPGASSAALNEILAAGASGRAAVKAHPALNPTLDLTSGEIDELVAAGSPAIDVELVKTPGNSIEVARAVLARTEPEPEPIVIGLAVRRFGARVLVGTTADSGPVDTWSGTRVGAASWFAPALGFVTRGFPKDVREIEAASEILGSSRQAWETFVALLPSWHEGAVDAAHAAVQV
jgi:hypothetical protein